VEFRLDGPPTFTGDRQGVVAASLRGGFAALMDAINKARPSGAKGLYIKRIVVNATMGPGIKIDPNAAMAVEATE
jgi:large subunit ribosomal protein L1